MKSKISPVFWSVIFMAAALALTLYVAVREKAYFCKLTRFTSPDIPLGPVTTLLFGVVVVMAVVLFFIPLKWLKYVFKALFALMFAWGVLVV